VRRFRWRADEFLRKLTHGGEQANPTRSSPEQSVALLHSLDTTILEVMMRKYLLAAAIVTAVAAPAFADEVGVHVGPVGAGVTVGQSHEYRDRDRDRTTVVKERAPADRTTVIKKHDELGNRSKTVIHHDND
jgi:hypothetical protein